MDIAWLNLILMAVFSVGHTAIIVGVINRVQGIAFPHPVMKVFKLTHDLVIVVFPVALIWFAGVNGPSLLYGGEWLNLPVALLAYLTVCGGVCCALPMVALYRFAAPTPLAQLSNHSETIDISRRLGYCPVARGPAGLAIRLPGNESLMVEVSEKCFQLPRLPAAWNGISILHVTDLHFTGNIDRAYFEQVVELGMQMQPDLVAFTGDLLDRADLIDWLPETLGRLNAPLGCYFVLGNHDWYLENVADIRQRLERLGWVDVAGCCRVVDHLGHMLAIGGTERPWMGSHPDFSEVPGDAFRLLLSHTPDNLPWARRQGVDLMLAGHNHGGQIRLPLFGPVYSPSLFGCRFASGVFWEDPTLLYVSRGISAKQPLRWRCPPELTKLVLSAEVRVASPRLVGCGQADVAIG